jgi:hypothetical protein
MKSDKSRETFDATNHFSSVRLQQGRVLTDADWNEQSDIIEHRDETTSIDVIGQSGVPVNANGFMIGDGGVVSGVADLTITGGRMYVDGILCEQEDANLRYSAQPDPAFGPDLASVPAIPTGNVLAYIDVWQRHIGVVEDPFIREVALGGPDTATRAKTVWQVKTLSIDANGGTVANALAGLENSNPGALAARAQPSSSAPNPCIIPQAAGFRSLENQLYRVEVHAPGELTADPAGSNGLVVANGSTQPTFKWSRDNGSVVAAWIDDPNPRPNTLRIKLLTNDAAHGFQPGNWVELSDDIRDLSGFGGIFVQLAKVENDVLTYDPATIKEAQGITPHLGPAIVRSPDERHPKVRRWDMPAGSGGPQLLTRAASTTEPTGAFIDLEAGVQVQFEQGVYRTGDYWVIPARTATNDVEWPPVVAGSTEPAQLQAFGIKHHFACLATFTFDGNGFPGGFDDCRKVFSPLTDLNPVTPDDRPQPDEYRYYLVDGTGAVGNDAAGKVGIAQNDPAAAYHNAVPFLSLDAAIKTFPRDGNGSIAVVMLTPIPAGAVPPVRVLALQGVHGYRKILIRGSNFVDQTTNTKIDPLSALDDTDIQDWVACGATKLFGATKFTIDTTKTPSLAVINVGPTPVLINVATDQLVGLRLRFTPESRSQKATMVLGNSAAASDGSLSISIADPFSNSFPGGNDTFWLEEPAVAFNAIEIGVVGTEQLTLTDQFVTDANPNISLVGLNANTLRLSGPVAAELAMCEINALTLGRFGHAKITPNYTDELGAFGASSRFVGVGVKVDETITMYDGDGVDITNSVVVDTQLVDVGRVNIFSFSSQSTSIIDCDKFIIGSESPNATQRFVRLGGGLSTGTALAIENSDGEVAGTSFEIRNIHNEAGTSFDFNANDDGVDLAAMSFTGTGRSLRIRDVDLTVAATNPQTAFNASGVLLDATGAVASLVDYAPLGSPYVSGLIALPGRVFFRPYELLYTDFRDAADNHYLSPSVSSKDVATSPNPSLNDAFQGRSFTQKGIPVQALTTGNEGVPRYRVVQFVGDGSTSRVQVARINLVDNVTRTPMQIAASVAGVMQQTILPTEDSKAFGMCIPSGYTLIALDNTDLDSTPLPAPLYCSGNQFGLATVAPPTSSGQAVVRIGVLVRVVIGEGFETNNTGDNVVGLARLQIDLDAKAGS